jgi:hypothetical protein
MTDNADLIRRLEEEAEHEAFEARKFTLRHNHSRAAGHAYRAALLQEAAKALRIEEATRNQQNVAYGPAGKAP